MAPDPSPSPDRLPWKRIGGESGFFLALPAPEQPEAYASISFHPTHSWHKWSWTVCWPNRFRKEGLTESKQAAADAATAAWWRLIDTTEERPDPEVEIAALLDSLAAGFIDVPDLGMRENAWLTSLIWHIRDRWATEIRGGTLYPGVLAAMRAASIELGRRRGIEPPNR